MDNQLTIVFDCGATNVRAVAVNAHGIIEAMHSLPNSPQGDPFYTGGLIWDIDEIWEKFKQCTRNIVPKIDVDKVAAITVTTFGVNGAPVDDKGNLIYPVISWQCHRTEPMMKNIGKYISLKKLYSISGVNEFSFNTINTLLWLKENKPKVLNKMAGWLFMPSLFVYKLTGEMVNDTTMAGTSMLTDLSNRSISHDILSATGIPDKFFSIREPGTIAGTLLPQVASELGLSDTIPVIITGHDTQFALIGSGAIENEVVLSSGTWEILMTRTHHVNTCLKSLNAGITNEFDAEKGLINTGIQWLASGVLEWVKNMFYIHESVKESNIYDIMISEAEIEESANTVRFIPDFTHNKGAIMGLGLQTKRASIYRAALESIVDKLKISLELLEQNANFKAHSIIVVGGGSKNNLWNKLRARKLGIPVKIAQQIETTVLGASLYAQTAVGTFDTIEKAVNQTCRNYIVINPE